MVWDWLGSLFGRGAKLPRDQVTRIPRAVRKLARPHVTAMQQAIDALGALPGLADIAVTKRLPKGFTDAVRALQTAHDEYIATCTQAMGLSSATRPGTPEGRHLCHEVPLGVTASEGAVIYRTIRPWPDFPQVAQRLAELGQRQFEEIQSRHKGKDPEKIKMGGKAVREGRLAFTRAQAQEGVTCPLFDEERGRCRIWDVRPQSCRMHHVVSDPAGADPRGEHYPDEVEAKNLRLPVRQQVALMQVEKRMMMQASPFLHANVIQNGQLTEGDQLYEVGEAPLRFQQGGTAVPKANRNRASAKKFQKGKGKGKGKRRK